MKELIKKWWFWLIILIIIVAIGFTSIALVGLNMINPDENLTNLARELQEYDDNIIVYQSAGKNTILIDCCARDEDETKVKAKDIGKIIGKYLSYLTVYDRIEFYFYTEEGQKATFTYNIETQKMQEGNVETWILEDSTAYNEKQNELEELQSKEDELNSEISLLEGKKQTLNSEIEQLNGEVIKLKGEPKTYPAGHLIAGTDVPIGKYKIYGGNSNFAVYSSYGELEVNIILGGSYGVSEYIYTFKAGDKIEARSPFKLIALE